MTDDPEILMSPLCQEFVEDEESVNVKIYSGDGENWILEVVDSNNASVVWESTFPSDQEALDEFRETVSKIRLQSLLAGE